MRVHACLLQVAKMLMPRGDIVLIADAQVAACMVWGAHRVSDAKGLGMHLGNTRRGQYCSLPHPACVWYVHV